RTRGCGTFFVTDEIHRRAAGRGEPTPASETVRGRLFQTCQDPLDIPGWCRDNRDMMTTQDSTEFETLATTTWWMHITERAVWEEATLEAEGIDPAEEDEWEQVRWIGRVTIDALVDPDEFPFGGDVIVTSVEGFVVREVAAGQTVDLWVPVDRRGGPVDDTPVGLVEIAERLGVERQTVDAWRHRGVLPDPAWTVGGRPAWAWSTIEEWARHTGRLS